MQGDRSKSQTAIKLPDHAVSLAGIEFNPQRDKWTLIDQASRVVIDWSKLAKYVDFQLLKSIKLTLLWYVENKSLSHAHNIHEKMIDFFSTIFTDALDRFRDVKSKDIVNYHGSLNSRSEWYLGVLSGFFKKWHRLGYPGLSPDVPKLFHQLTLKGNSKGEAVQTMDPKVGPFTDIEEQAFQSALNFAYAEGKVSLRLYALSWLFRALGSRPVQFAVLKIKDFLIQQADDGSCSYLLNVPRAKQRNQLARTKFKTRHLSYDIGQIVKLWIEEVKNYYEDNINDGIDHKELPIFPCWESTDLIGFEYHCTGQQIAAGFRSALEKIVVISERTGTAMHLNASRFRKTLATRAAEEGFGELVIAELLDHTDTQQVGIYVEATPKIAYRINKALAQQLAPLAQAFAGVLIDDESQAIRGDDPSSRIRDPRVKDTFGSCGKYGFCGALAPVACYTCRNFQAWIDGPHEEFLDALLEERERVLDRTGDERIAAVNDRVILAVTQVVEACREKRNQIEESTSV